MWKITSVLNRRDPAMEEAQNLEALLHGFPLFEHLEPGQLAKLIPAVRFKGFKDEEIVCHCPDAFHDAFVLFNGVVAVSRKKGEILHVLHLEKPGAVFNIGPLVGLGQEEAGVRALGNVEIVALDTQMLKPMLERDPKLGFALACNLSRLALNQLQRQIERYLE
ncbi:MAG: cyclic nucleotide-binding domain-containing protein [Chloroflexi bacterium]|nr:cyclic nucleotide-binding domain-containing protein [Chloroflexota bacterium]